MDIKLIKNPKFLKEASVKECQVLGEQIREFLINSISKTGGHLASNLGVVELTIALHKAFNSPEDKIFFDVGHQCYTHKILTGRANEFNKLRQYNGLSGYQKFEESEHDVWEAGHSSTSLSAALGMAIARDLNNEKYHVVPIIGDGALGSGMALEALNNIGSEKRNMIIVFNDNNMSISNNVGAMTKGFARLRTEKRYNSLKQEMKTALNKTDVGKNVLNGLRGIRNIVKEQVVDAGIFGEFDIDYLGPVDGHNIRDLINAFEVAKNHEGPIVIHVLTKKGKGYKFCEEDSVGKWHGVGPFNIATGKPLVGNEGKLISWSQVISDALYELAKEDEDILVLTPAMIAGSKLEKFFAKYPERSFDCGIAEEHAVTLSAALALSNKKPFLSIYSSFLQRGYDQLNHDVCRMNLPVVFGIDRAGIVGEDGDTHHGVFDISFMRSLPNIIMSQPKDAKEANNLLYTAFNQKQPFSIRIPRGSTESNNDKFEKIEIGSWSIFNDKEYNKVVVLTYGPDVDKILNKILVNNLPITVVNCRFFKPLDNNMLEYISNKKLKTIIYETDILIGGLGSAILEWANDNKKDMDIVRFGIDDQFVTFGSVNQLRKDLGIDINSLFDVLLNLI
ncbi:MAG: 1-deoxy-D-xylulose-5-phosphate synthase [Bacillota bacterium]|nr:1-deoxy-D-xylulose-5-phosphate synthase [Bacillota bacterium]NLP22660.1 1-deoxy-D-xylulose-5-phosphate synthase [Erysipelotrichaceae bacterium]